MKIFITGATGYIGFHVACALRRAGHEVWGLVRRPEKASILVHNEIHPVIGSMERPESYQADAAACAVLVHAAQDQRGDTVGLDRRTVETLISLGGQGSQPKTLLYTSGVWIYGDTGRRLVDETTPLAPVPLVAWRPPIEQAVLNASGVRPVVIRPGCVYGRQGGLTGLWFDGAVRQREVTVVGDGNNRWTMIHVDDLADGYVRVIESGAYGEIFNFTDRSRATVAEMARAASRAAGCDGEVRFVPVAEAAKTMGGFADCLALDQHVDSRKAVRVLGWQPRHGGFVDGVDLFFASWKAAHSE
ncbi:MAG: NAD-dependent epimerase/dehydratase family protein [Candidatus Zixiibacteriota bacterium]